MLKTHARGSTPPAFAHAACNCNVLLSSASHRPTDQPASQPTIKSTKQSPKSQSQIAGDRLTTHCAKSQIITRTISEWRGCTALVGKDLDQQVHRTPPNKLTRETPRRAFNNTGVLNLSAAPTPLNSHPAASWHSNGPLKSHLVTSGHHNNNYNDYDGDNNNNEYDGDDDDNTHNNNNNTWCLVM